MLVRARELATELGQPYLVEQASLLLVGLTAPVAPAAAGPGERHLPPVFSREGEGWTVHHGSRILQLRDSKGMQILATLLASPAREFHALDLVEGNDGPPMLRGDAGVVIDSAALSAYRKRVAELGATIEEAEAWNDVGRATRAQEEREKILGEIRRATGLGGRVRRVGSAAERARINVQRRVKDAIAHIAALDSGLGQHLEWAVKTGTFCSYEPAVDAATPVARPPK